MYHSHALVESEDIGDGTRIWAFAHVMAGAKIGANCNIGDHAFVESGAVIGDNVTIKNGVSVWEGVSLGNGVFVGPNAVFTNDIYPRSPRLDAVQNRYSSRNWLRTTIVQEGATIGANATIICGITLGTYCFIGAGALVTRNVPPHALMLGSPARERGWVCYCAHPLISTGVGWACLECRRRYDSSKTEIILPNFPAPSLHTQTINLFALGKGENQRSRFPLPSEVRGNQRGDQGVTTLEVELRSK